MFRLYQLFQFLQTTDAEKWPITVIMYILVNTSTKFFILFLQSVRLNKRRDKILENISLLSFWNLLIVFLHIFTFFIFISKT